MPKQVRHDKKNSTKPASFTGVKLRNPYRAATQISERVKIHTSFIG